VIIDIQRFMDSERRNWQKLEAILKRTEEDGAYQMNLEQLQEFHHLYRRASADLAKISTFASEQEIRSYLESLVARAYGEIHETREKPHHFAPFRWFFKTFPQTFRRHVRCFWLSLGVTILGCVFGGAVVSLDPEAKEIIMPFSHLQDHPSERVKREEKMTDRDRLEGAKTFFSSHLMTHNTKVSILVLALGMTWGVGTLLLLFYNGVILGAVALDYALAGETKFLLGWLMPHGVIEIPAILLAGQAGLLLGGALIGWGRRIPLRMRLREIGGDVITLIFGVTVMLVWAGFIEAFLSQYHEPVLPYAVKITFGFIELALLIWFLGWSGRKDKRSESVVPGSKLQEAKS